MKSKPIFGGHLGRKPGPTYLQRDSFWHVFLRHKNNRTKGEEKIACFHGTRPLTNKKI
jgi:hypothetical protein